MVVIPLSALFLAAAVAGLGADTVQLPARTLLDLWLVTPISEQTTPADHEITLKLARDLKIKGQVIAAKGSTVTARVTRLQKSSAFVHSVQRTYYIVGLQLVSLNVGEKPIPVSGNLETVGPAVRQEDYFIPFSHSPDKWGALEEYRAALKTPQPRPGESFLGVVREGLSTPKDLRMAFLTTETQ